MSAQPPHDRFGRFGGRYVAEALWEPLHEVAVALEDAVADLEAQLADRPTDD